jgi:hypothetical protein
MGFIDMVIGGPDMSGTSTQIKGVIAYLQAHALTYRDLRGTEEDTKDVPFDLDSADLWVMEEPTFRGAGLVVREIINRASDFGLPTDGLLEATVHQMYRSEEFVRFRKPLREAGKVILRSRSEESATYQMHDEEALPSGPTEEQYLTMPGHKIAFANAPTDIIVVHAGEEWTADEYLALKEERSSGRKLDDLEKSVPRQLLVNRRYATDWLEKLYEKGTEMHGGEMPNIHRVEMYNANRVARGPEDLQEEINGIVEKVLDREAA